MSRRWEKGAVTSPRGRGHGKSQLAGQAKPPSLFGRCPDAGSDGAIAVSLEGSVGSLH